MVPALLGLSAGHGSVTAILGLSAVCSSICHFGAQQSVVSFPTFWASAGCGSLSAILGPAMGEPLRERKADVKIQQWNGVECGVDLKLQTVTGTAN